MLLLIEIDEVNKRKYFILVIKLLKIILVEM